MVYEIEHPSPNKYFLAYFGNDYENGEGGVVTIRQIATFPSSRTVEIFDTQEQQISRANQLGISLTEPEESA